MTWKGCLLVTGPMSIARAGVTNTSLAVTRPFVLVPVTTAAAPTKPGCRRPGRDLASANCAMVRTAVGVAIGTPSGISMTIPMTVIVPFPSP